MKNAANLPTSDRELSRESTTNGVRLPSGPSGVKKIFVGPNGPRAGWRLIIFFALLAIQSLCVPLISRSLAKISPPSDLPKGAITPIALGANEVVLFAMVGFAAWIMAKVERRRFREYGLPLRGAFRPDFWVGVLLGFSVISATLLTMFLFHGFHIDGFAIHGLTILPTLVEWTAASVMVGLFEEFAFRGYLQYTLTSGIGFWPAAFVISGLFGLGHLLANLNENFIGSVSVGIFGLLMCLLLQRTGTLWCAVGFHFAYDWGETFFFGVPDSGVVPYHSLLSSEFSGPHWLTGGKVGPEASMLTPIALAVAAWIFCRYYREKQYPRQVSTAEAA